MKPLVSVIVPTYNRPELLYRALLSIEQQTYPAIETIVVNDAGVDVRAVVSQFIGTHYHSHPENRGLATSRNSGIRLAGGKYLCYLDDDDFYYPNHIAVLVDELDSSDYKIAYTDANRMYPDGQKDVPFSMDFDYRELLAHNLTPVLCVMHERILLDESGCFDESLDSHEDWDLWIRLGKLYPMKHITQTTCCYTVDRNSDKMSNNYPRMLRTHTIVKGRHHE